jgi:hypothetical protein
VRASVPPTFASRFHSAAAMSRDLALAKVSTEDEGAVRSFPCSVVGARYGSSSPRPSCWPYMAWKRVKELLEMIDGSNAASPI